MSVFASLPVDQPPKCIKFDCKNDTIMPPVHEGLDGPQALAVAEHLYGNAFTQYDLVFFSEVRGQQQELLDLATKHGYGHHRTVTDEQGWAMLVCWNRQQAGISVRDYIIDLATVYADLRALQQKQLAANAPSSAVCIGCETYALDLAAFDFTRVPAKFVGVHAGRSRIFKYTAPQAPSPANSAAMLAKIIYLYRAVQEAIAGNYAYIGDANIIFNDSPILTVVDTGDGDSGGGGGGGPVDVFKAVLAQLAPHTTRLNDGKTIRTTLLDALSRRKLGVAGWKLDIPDDDEYLQAMLTNCYEFDYAFNCKTALGAFAPRAEAVAQLRGLLWSDAYVDRVRAARNMDGPGRFAEVNKVWRELYSYVIANGVSVSDANKTVYEEDHIRIGWGAVIDALFERDRTDVSW